MPKNIIKLVSEENLTISIKAKVNQGNQNPFW